MQHSVSAQFMTLFEGNNAGYGTHKLGARGKWSHATVKGKVPLKAFTDHLRGRKGIGIVPIRSDNTCMFGCIDVDSHHGPNGTEVNVMALSRKVERNRLPLITCRSKSGGAHLYVFFETPVSALHVKHLLTDWAHLLDLDDTETEIFPKQTKLNGTSMGNTINLPYFDAANTERYAVIDGKKLTVHDFLLAAEERRVSREFVQNTLRSEYNDAPPCIQHMLDKGVPQGARNEAIYNIAIYMRRKFPKEYQDKMFDVNVSTMTPPLGLREFRATIASANKETARYRCSESPCRDFCDKELCRTRLYGVGDTQKEDEVSVDDLFRKLRKHLTDPVQWEITVLNASVLVTTQVLMDYRRLMEAVADATTTIIPAMKTTEWHRILADLMANAEHVAAPRDATTGGSLADKLSDFIRRATPPSQEVPKVESRLPLKRGQPVAEFGEDGVTVIVHFRGRDFIEFLRRARQGTVKGSAVWMALKKQGVVTGRVSLADNSTINVWSVKARVDDQMVVPDFSEDF